MLLVINLVGHWLNLHRNENEVSNAFISIRQAAIFDRVDEDNRKLHQHFPLTLSFIKLCPSEKTDDEHWPAVDDVLVLGDIVRFLLTQSLVHLIAWLLLTLLLHFSQQPLLLWLRARAAATNHWLSSQCAYLMPVTLPKPSSNGKLSHHIGWW